VRRQFGIPELGNSAVRPWAVLELADDATIARFDGRTSRFGYGGFALGQPGFAGIRFATARGNFDYGWIQLEVNGSGGIPDS
jgi:hypothetical protein